MKTCSNPECTAENPQPDDQFTKGMVRCRTCVKEANALWRKNNPEKVQAALQREKDKRIAKANDPAVIAAKAKLKEERAEARRVKQRENQARWRKNNPDKVAAQQERRRASVKPRKPKVKKPKTVKTLIPKDFSKPSTKAKQEKLNRQKVEEILERKRLREEENYL